MWWHCKSYYEKPQHILHKLRKNPYARVQASNHQKGVVLFPVGWMGSSLDGGKWRVPQWATLNSKKLLQKVHNMLMSAGFFGGQNEDWCALLYGESANL